MANIEIVPGQPAHVDALLACITEQAAYEKAAEQVEVSRDELLRDGFGPNPLFSFLVAMVDGKVAGIALYYYKYSTWKGKALFLEDIVVKHDYRRMGIGKKLFVAVCRAAHEAKCRRMDWQVLDWNEPAIGFYKQFGARLDPEWLNGQLFTADLARIAHAKY